jgi:tagaturonate reductase
MTFPIIQFGASRFLQAHVDLFVSQALARLAVIHDNHDAKKRRRFGSLIELANAPIFTSVSRGLKPRPLQS